METRANYALIGAFVLLAASTAIGFVLWLGSTQFNRDFAQYDIVFEGPVSLEEGASVRYIGIKVGEVESVKIDGRDASKVRARIRVDKTTPVKQDSTAIIDFAGITGVTFVQINAGSDDADELQLQPYQDVPVIKAGSAPLAELFSSGTQIAGQASLTLDQASKLLTDENVEAFRSILHNLDAISTVLAEDDGTLVNQANETLASLTRAGDRLAVASDSVTNISGSLGSEIETLNIELKALVAELNSATGEASTTLSESRKTIEAATALVEGPTSSTLAQTGMAAQEMRILISRLDRIVRDIEQNPQSLVVGNPRPYED